MKKSSRKEAPLSEWKKLYDLAARFMKKKPWEILMNEEYICIRFSEDDEAFFTIMGNGGLEYGFGMYIGEAAFCEMLLQIRYAHEPVTDEYIMFMQNCLVMFQDKKSDIPEEQLDVIKKLKLDFGRGRKWLYFEDHARGYAPYIPDARGVQDLIRYMEQLLPCLDLIEKMKPRGLHLVDHGYIYAQKEREWKLGVTSWNPEELGKLHMAPQDDTLLKNMAGKWKQLNVTWELDVIAMDLRIDDENYDRPLFPHLLLIADHKSGGIIYQNMLPPECGLPELCGEVTELMINHGRPKKILVSGSFMKQILSAMEEATGVPLKAAPLPHIMNYKASLLGHLQAQYLNEQDGSIFRQFGLKDDEVQTLMAMAGVNSEDELLSLLSESVGYMKDPLGGMFLGSPENCFVDDYDFEDDYNFENEYGSEEEFDIRWESPQTIPQKEKCIRDFFENTFSYEDTEPIGEYSLEDIFDIEELTDGVIDADWSDDWEMMIDSCKVGVLQNILLKLGLKPAGKKKKELADVVYALLSAKPGRIKEFIDEEDRALIKKMRTLANSGDCLLSDSFPYAPEQVIRLLEHGIIDIRKGHSMHTEYLTIVLPRRLKGIHL